MNWYIGQEIVCIKTHPQGVVKRGKIYIIEGLKRCTCNHIFINVGVVTNLKLSKCSICGKMYEILDGIGWLSESRFAPLEYNQDAINELLEQPILIER